MRVGCDSDGVIDNFGEGVKDTLFARDLGHLWKSGPTKKSFWNFYEDWGWTFQQFKELVDWGVDEGYIFTGHWRPNAIESLARIKNLGHELIIITDRSFGTDPLNSQSNTIEAFRYAGIEYDEIHFTADKTSIPVDVMVEDKIENFVALEAAGTKTFLITRSWNEDFGPHPLRINDISDYADAVESMTLSLT